MSKAHRTSAKNYPQIRKSWLILLFSDLRLDRAAVLTLFEPTPVDLTAMSVSTFHNTQLSPVVRTLDNSASVLRSALRRVVHDHVAGWGIVLFQTPQERRRKKRLWDHRSSVRHAFCRPVQMFQASRIPGCVRPFGVLAVEQTSDEFLVHDLSDRGIGLSSDHAPRSRLIVLSFDVWRGQPVEMAVWLRWRKRVGYRSWRCGGSLLGVLVNDTPNLAEPQPAAGSPD